MKECDILGVKTYILAFLTYFQGVMTHISPGSTVYVFLSFRTIVCSLCTSNTVCIRHCLVYGCMVSWGL